MNKKENMNKIKIVALNGVVLAATIALQMINLPNIVTGVIVNSIFIFMTLHAGVRSSVVLCLLSPFGALISGHLAGPMYPVLPVIAIGNALMVILFSKFYNKSMWKRLLIPAFVKALFIGLIGLLAVNLFLPDKVANFILFGVLGIQFFTAVPGIWFGIKLNAVISRGKG